MNNYRHPELVARDFINVYSDKQMYMVYLILHKWNSVKLRHLSLFPRTRNKNRTNGLNDNILRKSSAYGSLSNKNSLAKTDSLMQSTQLKLENSNTIRLEVTT